MPSASFDPQRPFLRADGERAGITPAQFRGPGLRQLFQGVYVDASVDVDAHVRATAALLAAPRNTVVARHTAATLWALPRRTTGTPTSRTCDRTPSTVPWWPRSGDGCVVAVAAAVHRRASSSSGVGCAWTASTPAPRRTTGALRPTAGLGPPPRTAPPTTGPQTQPGSTRSSRGTAWPGQVGGRRTSRWPPPTLPAGTGAWAGAGEPSSVTGSTRQRSRGPGCCGSSAGSR